MWGGKIVCKFLRDFLCVIICFICYEYVGYIKDYDQIIIMAKYVVYDVNNSSLKSFYNNKFDVEILYKDDDVEYVITMKRDSLFNIKRFKTIEYHGLVE